MSTTITPETRWEFVPPPPRALPYWMKREPAPTAVMADALRAHRDELTKEQEMTQSAWECGAKLAEAVTLALHRKDPTGTDPQFRTLWSALDDAGVDIDRHLGEPVEDLEEELEIIGWTDPDADLAPGTIAETVEPEISFQYAVVHRAKVIAVRDIDIDIDDDEVMGIAGLARDDGTDGADDDDTAVAHDDDTGVAHKDDGDEVVTENPDSVSQPTSEVEAGTPGDHQIPGESQPGFWARIRNWFGGSHAG